MKFVRLLTLYGLALPVWAQYAGPAILSRGEAPAAMSSPDIKFRPYVEVTVGYQTGLAGVAYSNAQGTLPQAESLDLGLAWGVSGSHNWRHTRLGLDYRGSLAHYLRFGNYDSISQTFLMSLSQQLTRHVSILLRENGGVFTRAFGLASLSQSVSFDPSQSYIPTTDFFDNRTYYVSSQLDLRVQKTARLSFDLGGDNFLTRYRAAGLVGTNGFGARGDVQYRVSRRSTLGASYHFEHFGYTGQYGAAEAHSFEATYSRALAAKLEFSASAGASRIEQTFIRSVPVDPVIAALLGVATATEIGHFVSWIPVGNVRLAEVFHQGVAYLSGSRSITPGNGLFTTSYTYSVSGGYTYTGLRRWSMSALSGYDRSRSVGNFNGNYSDVTGGFVASRQIARAVHFVFGYDFRKYSSPDFKNYNRPIQEGHVGLGFTPGDVPLRVW